MKLTIAATLLLALTSANAQFVITWFNFPGGGGQTSDGTITLSGSIGHVTAEKSAGGDVTLAGGFWAVLPDSEPTVPPLLRIFPAGSSVVLAWPSAATGYRLQQSSSLSTRDWTDVNDTPENTGPEMQLRQPIAAGSRFYRLFR
jgi:hypothetical protein